ncbi:hypothetical protein FHW88_005206 [Mucilaginibacter sp. SG538B]|uniref:hypothetical protein n=1 Tax=Mucilaginibacter sp. SG538B TaxID=2587021 RepID=UPI00159DC521|nr:hypothetical protein [Mucilaginibacter sp. SG538B]NVM66888.1 hypothetical protein [Mucilaginibacter sp. SG538B]
MPRKKILITVTTYPLPSRSYDELVCTAGICEDGSWIRIYPVPFKFLRGLRNDGMVNTYKFTWIELDLRRRTEDFRPESHSPVNYSFSDLTVCGSIEIKGGNKAKLNAWKQRKLWCANNVYSDMTQLIKDSQEPKNVSLITFKPTKLLSLDHEDDEREWKQEWKEQLNQLELFVPQNGDQAPRKLIPKLPYRFFYRFEDCNGRISRLMIEDWEIGQLYFNCVNTYRDEKIAIQKVKEKYWDQFIARDLFFFLGTTKEWHTRRAKNPFVIIGVFYPPIIPVETYSKDNQLKFSF